jgi:predicted ATPase
MTTNAPTRFGELLRKFRLSATLSQEALAERSGLSVDAIRALERGRRSTPRPDTLGLLLEALNLSASDRQLLIDAADHSTGLTSMRQVPTARSRSARPQMLGPLIGRQSEREAIALLLLERRLPIVSLIGPGGVGKTRLALSIAEESQDEFLDGMSFIDLSPVRSATLVAPTIAQALGLREAGENDAQHLVLDFLMARQMLLVLDNFEQVIPAAELIGEIRDRCPNVVMLITSRTPLRLRGEQQFRVPPLATPAVRLGSYHEIVGNAAVQLFLARAQAVQPDFELSENNLSDVAGICARLDGLPLAIEMAAARISLLPPRALLQRLRRRLNVLTGGLSDLPPRQRTLRATIDWSYNLLAEEERSLFRHLSVFASEWSLDAAEWVCGGAYGAGNLDGESSVLEYLGSLVDGSLVRLIETRSGEPRYAMLETMREFASERALEYADVAQIGERHAAYFLDLAETSEKYLVGADQTEWLDRLEQEHDNMRAALGWSLESDKIETGLRIAGALWRFWWQRGYLSEGAAWFDQLLARPLPDSQVIRARALNGAGNIAWTRGDLAKARTLHEACLELRRELGDEPEIAKSLNNLGLVATYQRREEQAVAYFEESLEIHQRFGLTRPVAGVLINLGEVVLQQGDLERANALILDSLRLYREFGDPRGTADSLHNLGGIACDLGEHARARRYLAESVLLYRDVGDQHGIAACLENYASVLAAIERFEQATWLLGCAAQIRGTLGGSMTPVERARLERSIGAARHALGDEAFTSAIAHGATLPIEVASAMIDAGDEPGSD